MTIRELRERAGMSRREFAEYFHISYRTVQDWELGCNKCKDYTIRAFYYSFFTRRKSLRPAVRSRKKKCDGMRHKYEMFEVNFDDFT